MSNLASVKNDAPPKAEPPSDAKIPTAGAGSPQQPGRAGATNPPTGQVSKPAVAKAAPRGTDKAALPADPAAAYAALALEGPIADPSSAAELYHNARLHEAKGDRPAALRSYAALLARTGEFIDADLRYAALLRLSGGAGAARQTFADLARTGAPPALGLAAAMQAEPAERRARLEAFASANPDFAPASYILAEDYLAERTGSLGGTGAPTVTERRLAFDALNTFLETSAEPKSVAAFLDRAVLTTWRDAARRRQSEVEAAFAGSKTRPSATFARSDAGWTASLSLPEPAQAITVRIGERGESEPAVLSQATDPRTGKPITKASVEIAPNQGRSTLYVSYTDPSGHVAGPFPIPFDPMASLISTEREILERYPETWVAFRPDLPNLLSVTQLLSNRCAIQQVLVGYGDEPPRQQLRLPPCNEQNPYAIPAEARSVLTLPDGTEAIQVQLTYADGTESQVRTFRRP